MALPIPPINPNTRIPNDPFYYPEQYYLNGPFGPLIIGSGLNIDYFSSTISATGGGGGGAVNQIIAGSGINVSPGSGTGNVTISLPTSGVTAGTYTNTSFTVNSRGVITSVSSGPTPVTSVSGTAPISVTSGGSPVVSIAAASTTGSGAVQLYNNTNSTSTSLALTAAQGKSLQDQLNGLLLAGNLSLAGTINANTALVDSTTSAGTADGIIVGSTLPVASAGNKDDYVIVTTPGTMTPPGGSPVYASQGDWFVSSETSPGVYAWTFLNVGYDAVAAGPGVAGIVCLSTDAMAQAGTDITTALTPAAAASAYIKKSCITAKGTLVTGTAANTPFALPVGADTQVLTACAACPTGLTWAPGGSTAIPCALLTAKGQIVAATAANTPFALPVGTNGQVLTACSACASGLTWVTGAGGAMGDTPVGTVNWFAASSAPVGWLVADGSAVSRTTYADLFAVIGITYGSGDGSTTFNLPDLRGQFIRGIDNGRGCDSGRVFGSTQQDMIQCHKHVMAWGEATTSIFGNTTAGGRKGSAATDTDNYWYYTNDGTDYDGTLNPVGVIGCETRPMNVAMLPCIKYLVTTAPVTPTSGIPCACITAKGALITGTAASTPVALPVGSNGQVLIADSASATGLTWGTAPTTALDAAVSFRVTSGCLTGGTSQALVPGVNGVAIVSDFNSCGWFNPTTGRFTPTVAGYYQVNYQVGITNSVGSIIANLYCNGSILSESREPNNGSNAGNGSITGAQTVYMNGSTDYLQLGGASTLNPATLSLTRFSAALIGAVTTLPATYQIAQYPGWTSAGTVQSNGMSAVYGDGSVAPTPTFGTTPINNMRYRQIGPKEWEVQGVVQQTTSGTAGGGWYLFTLPAGLQFDLTSPYQRSYQQFNSSTGLMSFLLGGSWADFAINGAETTLINGIIPWDATRYRIMPSTVSSYYPWADTYYAISGSQIWAKWGFTFTTP